MSEILANQKNMERHMKAIESERIEEEEDEY